MSCTSFEELQTATEDWSLRYLKELFHLYNLHISELLR